jgi:hypothetical protein
MKARAACLTAILVLSCSSLAAAGPIVEAAERAEMLLGSGDAAGALEALNEAVDQVWRESPLAFRRVVVVDSSAGYGVYSEKTDPTFRPDETMRVYVEPIGFGYRTAGASSTIGFTADLAIENTSGQVLGEAKDIFSIATPSAAGKREFSMTLSFDVPYLRPGEYKAIFTVDDQNSPKSAKFEVVFNVALPTGAGDGGQ